MISQMPWQRIRILVWVLVWVQIWPPYARADEAMSRRFAELIEEAWQFDVREDPLFATRVGDHHYDDRLPAVGISDAMRRLGMKQQLLKRLEAIDRSRLSPSDQVSYTIFSRLLQDEIAEYKHQAHLTPISNRDGFHISFPELRRQMPFDSVDNYENYIARLKAFATYAEQHVGLMRSGIEDGMVLPDVVLNGYQAPIEAHILKDPTESLFYEPFREFPKTISPSDQARLAGAGREAIRTSVVPGYRSFLAFMQDEYIPAARGSIGASALPHGREFYRHRVRKFTTLDVTPEQVHEIGLTEVKRIRAEMDTIIRDADFQGDFAAFVSHLRSDSQFYADSPEQLMKEVALVLKKMDGELPSLFGRLPRMPYGIRRVPDYIAPRTTTAYYMLPAGDGSRAGFYYVNTYDLGSRPLYEIEALSLHEAVPGHHLQLALQQEMDDLPEFRRFAGFTAFVEGWALYAERLGLQVGFYEDPYSNFGRLSYEMWRACRLVVDTGIHYFGWTRQRAIEFMTSNTALTEHNVRAEVDRYISWPGQALAYKMGELKIRELRKMAEERLGPRFDIRQFHDAVLGGGSVPLDVLEEQVIDYVDSRSVGL